MTEKNVSVAEQYGFPPRLLDALDMMRPGPGPMTQVTKWMFVAAFVGAGMWGWWFHSIFTLGLMLGWGLCVLYFVAREIEKQSTGRGVQ